MTTTADIMVLAEQWSEAAPRDSYSSYASLRTAVESLVKERDALRSKAEHLMTFVEGDLPIRGWLRDTDESRAAIGDLRAALRVQP